MIPAHLSAILTTARTLKLGTGLMHALAYLSIEREVTSVALARHLDITTSATTGLVDTLEDRGYIVRRSMPHDRRSYHIVITPAGDAVVSQLCQPAAA